MNSTPNMLLTDVANYYANKLAAHGVTPRGVDWNSEESQIIRFKQLCKILGSPTTHFSLADLGCGYGALLDFLKLDYSSFEYIGLDISSDMVHAASQRYKAVENARFIASSAPEKVIDYSVASGIFNVRVGRSYEQWRDYIKTTLDVLHSSSKFGFSFNCLTSYSDEHKKRDDLFYADPCMLFDLCKRRYSQQVALLHDYGLYEFTILVRKSQ